MLSVLLLLVAVFAKEFSLEKQFFDFKKQHNKNYTNFEEHVRRFNIFKANLIKIKEHNAKKLSYKFGVTQFADMTQYEFAQYVKRGNGGGYVPMKEEARKNIVELGKPMCDSVDWVSAGKVTPVKNQGQCGSCWSFSTTGAIEGRTAIAQNTEAPSISEQELVDCDQTDNACNGGLMDYGFEWVTSNGGLCSEVAYPYVSGQTKQRGSCKKDTCGTKFGKISSHADVTSKSQSELEAALCQGPVSIAIEADQSTFQLYTSGVLDGDCGANLDHGVLLVGFGTDSTYGDYWKVKNSWGTGWGDQGYIRLCRNCKKNCGFFGGCSGQCGLMKQPSYPIV